MTRLLLILFSIFLFLGCENQEDNTPALQASLDNDLYISVDSRASIDEDGNLTIQGITENETLTLRLSALELGTFNLGGNSLNYASFEDFNGNAYYTNPDGSGQVVVSNIDTEAEIITGSFKFTAILTGIDTLTVSRGIFFEVPYGDGVADDTGGNGNQTNAGTFISLIDGNPFNPFTITAINSGNSIVISANTTSRTLLLSVPLGSVPGSVVLPQQNYTAKYIDENIEENATSGNIIIISHDPVAKTIKGTFSFETASKSISLGQFNVVYN